MAIQLPDVGTGVPADKTGDSPWLAMKKVRENFNDQTNAASKLVGTTAGRVPLAEDTSNASFNFYPSGVVRVTDPDAFKSLSPGIHYMGAFADISKMPYVYNNILAFTGYNNTRLQVYYGYTADQNSLYYRLKSVGSADSLDTFYMVYSTANVTKDANGFLKGASPIVKVHADKVVLNEEAEQQNVTYKKNGIGDYTITTVSGLSTDGWYIELPKDMNGNPKVAVTLSEVDGVISLKTYKRVFSMETFTFEPDLDNPLDIPEGRWIDLRLNEIPVEHEEDINTEV